MSTYTIDRDDQVIDDQLNQAADYHETGRSRWPGMSYEQGVEAAIRWLIGESDDAPMED